MQTNLNTAAKTRLVDIIHMPAEQAIALLSTMPDFMGEAIAKLCYQHVSKHH